MTLAVYIETAAKGRIAVRDRLEWSTVAAQLTGNSPPQWIELPDGDYLNTAHIVRISPVETR